VSTIPSTTSSTNRIVLDYTSRDYKSIRSMLVGMARSIVPEWRTVGETGDFGTLLLELFAYSEDITNYYIDRLASEAFLGTAIRRQSALYIADMMGYTPMGNKAAVAPISFVWKFYADDIAGQTVLYNINSATCVSNLVTMTLSRTDNSVNLYPDQTIVVNTGTAAYDGQHVLLSVTDPNGDNSTAVVTYQSASATGTAITTIQTGKVTSGTVVIIPAKTVISTTPDSSGNTIDFELDFDVTMDSSKDTAPVIGADPANPSNTQYQVTKIATASEGVTVAPSKIGVSKGIPNAEFVLSNPGVIDKSVSIYTVEGGQAVTWSKIDKLSLAAPTQSVFTTYIDDDDYTHVIFGDNASGRVPPVNVEIRAGYRYGVGSAANSLGINSLTVLDNAFATSTGITVTNTAAPSGGADVESIESLRYSVPRAKSTLSRAITLDDYVNLALQVPGITKATAYGQNYTAVYVRVASSAQSVSRSTTSVTSRYVSTIDGVLSATLATSKSLNITSGQIVYVTDSGVSALNGTFTLSNYYSSVAPVTVTNKVIVAGTPNVATLTLSSGNSGLKVGQMITVADVSSTYNGTYVITAISTDGLQISYNTSSATSSSTSATGTITGLATIVYPVATGTSAINVAAAATGTMTTISNDMQSLIDSLESYLSDKKLIGAVVYGEPVEWTDIVINAELSVFPLYNRTAVQTAVQKAIEGVLSYDNVDFGKRISLGDVYRAVLNVEGAEYVKINSMYIDGTTVQAADVLTPKYNLPRLKPTLTGWITSTGGLAGT